MEMHFNMFLVDLDKLLVDINLIQKYGKLTKIFYFCAQNV